MFQTSTRSGKEWLYSQSSIVEIVDLARTVSQTAATRTDS